MNPDLTALYKKQYETLTDRLAKMDMAREGTTPEAMKRVSVGNRVELENPMTRIEAGMNIGNTSNRAQVQSMELQMKALDQLAQQINSNQPDSISQKDRLNLELQAADKGMELYTKEDGTLGVRPISSGGDTNFDAKAGAKMVKDGFKKLTDFPKAQQSAVEAELQNLTKTEANAVKDEALVLVDELLGMDTGAITGIKNPLKYLTGEAYEVENKVKQLVAKLSLESRKLLKGSGQVSDKESQMLEESVTALSQKLPNAAFKKELQKLRMALSGQGTVSVEDKKAEIDALFNQTMGVSQSAQLK